MRAFTFGHVRQLEAVGGRPPAEAIAAIGEDAWPTSTTRPAARPRGRSAPYNGRRLVVRRTPLTDRHQARLWPDWRHFAFLTDLTGSAVDLDAFHRHRAVFELAIRDLKEGAGMEHAPSGSFSANSAWLQCAPLGPQPRPLDPTIGDVAPVGHATVARTVGTRPIAFRPASSTSQGP